jgi:hypothetical protein
MAPQNLYDEKFHAPTFEYFRQTINFPLTYRDTKLSFFHDFQEF